MPNISRTPPLLKLLGKLRNVVVAVPDGDGPRRGWGSASSREIQLELDLDSRRRSQGGEGGSAKDFFSPRAQG